MKYSSRNATGFISPLTVLSAPEEARRSPHFKGMHLVFTGELSLVIKLKPRNSVGHKKSVGFLHQTLHCTKGIHAQNP